MIRVVPAGSPSSAAHAATHVGAERMAPLGALTAAVAASALAAAAAQFAPANVNVTAADSSLIIDWAITPPGGDPSIRSFTGEAAKRAGRGRLHPAAWER